MGHSAWATEVIKIGHLIQGARVYLAGQGLIKHGSLLSSPPPPPQARHSNHAIIAIMIAVSRLRLSLGSR